ncbi:hypothetical protein Tsubulata_025064, partial [Turnera subulata]
MKSKPPPGQCNQENDSDYCKAGKYYTTYTCSPPVTTNTKAFLTLNSFQKGGDGGGPSECDNQYHSDDTPVVALSTGWFSNKSRCHNNITINGNGRSVVAMVVDECDSITRKHGYFVWVPFPVPGTYLVLVRVKNGKKTSLGVPETRKQG